MDKREILALWRNPHRPQWCAITRKANQDLTLSGINDLHPDSVHDYLVSMYGSIDLCHAARASYGYEGPLGLLA